MTENRYHLRGEIDLATTPRLRADLRQAVAATDAHLIVDCTDLSFIDSQGIAILLEAQRDLADNGRRLLIVNVAPGPRQTFESLGLGDLLQQDREAAS